MPKNERDLTDKIMDFVARKGGPRSTYAIGVSKDPKKALKKHKVDMKKDPWMYDFADYPTTTQHIVDHLLMSGFDGVSEKADSGATGIYIYKKAGHTKEYI